jgi:hypothetical protein
LLLVPRCICLPTHMRMERFYQHFNGLVPERSRP